MRYRALFQDPGRPFPERPIEIYSNNVASIEQWSKTMIDASTSLSATVMIYESVEQEVAICTKASGFRPLGGWRLI